MLCQLMRRNTAPVLRRVGTTTTSRSFATPFNQVGSRSFASSSVATRIQEVHDQMLGTNWGDYLDLVHNEPFWKAAIADLEALHPEKDAAVKEKWEYLLKATDCMYAAEDVRDHINEILEMMTRKTGIMGMGINAGEAIENMDEQTEMLTKRYQELLQEYPDFKPKIEQSVGHGLAILRMKHKFAFPGGHRFFY